MKFRLTALPFVLPMALIAAPALAQISPAPQTTNAAEYPGGTTAVAQAPLPDSTLSDAREAWIAECGRRLDAVNEGRDGPEPFRQTCTAWLAYFQRNGVSAKEAYADPPSIPVTMVPLRVMVACKPAPVTPKVRYVRPRHDKRIRID